MNEKRAREIAARFHEKRIAVVGDLMLDRYIWGDATRISQEAPVPIVTVKTVSVSPGGAANVLRNLAMLGARPYAFGVVGDDLIGEELCALLTEQDVDVSGVQRDPARLTSEKTRIIAANQQVVRVDTEQIEYLNSGDVRKLKSALEATIDSEGLDSIIIEDYGKGVVTAEILEEVADVGRRFDIPIAQDPHPGNQAYTKGITILTPNRTEAFAMAGAFRTKPVLPIEDDTGLLDVVATLQKRWEPKYLLVTLGPDGMALFVDGEKPIHIATQAREVFDVSGAGDTVIAAFALSLIAGATPEEAVILSNHAAGIVVGKVGTVAVHADELIDSFSGEI